VLRERPSKAADHQTGRRPHRGAARPRPHGGHVAANVNFFHPITFCTQIFFFFPFSPASFFTLFWRKVERRSGKSTVTTIVTVIVIFLCVSVVGVLLQRNRWALCACLLSISVWARSCSWRKITKNKHIVACLCVSRPDYALCGSLSHVHCCLKKS